MSRPASDGAESSHCLQVEEGVGPTTLLVFSSRDAERFDYAWIAAQVGCKRVFVRDPSGAGWYNQGLPGHCQTKCAETRLSFIAAQFRAARSK